MRGPREVLNELKWREETAIERAEIWYVHRGAPGDARVVPGSDVVALHASFMELRAPRERGMGGTAMIPYHRVFRIDHEGATVWRRRSAEAAGAPDERAPEGERETDPG